MSMKTEKLGIDRIGRLLAQQSDYLLDYTCKKVTRSQLHLPGPDYVDRLLKESDRPTRVLHSMQTLLNHGRLRETGYLSILPVDQGVEHSAGASFSPNPIYFDPENIVELAIEGGCNACASSLGTLGSVARKYAHKIPFIVKINHNELLSYPNTYDQTLFANVQQAFDMGAVAIGATIYFGSPESQRQINEISEAFHIAHELGLVTILWAYLRNPAFKVNGKDYHSSADLTGQANHLAVTIEADIVKQKQPDTNAAYMVINNNESRSYGKYDERMYSQLSSEHPIDLTRYQLVNTYMGRVGLINSGGASGTNDLAQALATAVINKRAGGMGLISGRKAFQKPIQDGIELLHAIQDVYLCDEITVA